MGCRCLLLLNRFFVPQHSYPEISILRRIRIVATEKGLIKGFDPNHDLIEQAVAFTCFRVVVVIPRPTYPSG